MQDSGDGEDGRGLVSERTMDIAVALILLMGSVVFMVDSWRQGMGWRDDGPAPGFFPFWVAAILAVASAINIVRALPDRRAAGEAFVHRPALARVLAVLVPTTLFVAAIGGLTIGPLRVPGLGVYLASALFVTGFMWMLLEEKPPLGGAWLGALLVMAASGALTFALLALVRIAGHVPGIGFPLPIALLAGIGLAALPLGRIGPVLTIGPAAAIVLFVLFEIWFLVPLVKGPLEAWLGLG